MSKNKKTKKYFSWRNAFVAIFVGLFIFQFVQVQFMLGNFAFLSGNNGSFIKELGQVREAYTGFTEDLSEIREYLRLPKKTYDGLAPLDKESDEKNDKQVQLAMFKFVSHLSSSRGLSERMKESKAAFEALATSEEFAQLLKDNGLTSERKDFGLRISNETDLIAKVYIDEDGIMYRATVKDGVEKVSDISTYIVKNKEALVKHIEDLKGKVNTVSDLLSSDAVQQSLQSLSLRSDMTPNEQTDSYIYNIYGKLDTVLAELVVDKSNLKISLIDKANSKYSLQPSSLSESLVPFLTKLDNKTFTERKYFESLEEIQETLSDKGFKLLLKESGLSISENKREDDARIYYDILDSTGVVLNSIVLEKATGVVNVVDSKGANAENLLFFDPKFKKKTLSLPRVIPDYGNEQISSKDTFNILIAGKHGSLIDTMIFAHINESTREVKMISVPRDLLYDGKKINSLAMYYGMPELVRALSEISGYKLDKYILVDMYAFIDVVDLIGGIDITLTDPVIDPTYRTVDNGVEGTVNYAPGDYHLSGVQSLRLARSRHTSSDFARASRQQMILKSIQNKAKNFGFGDAKTLYQIVKSVLKQTETDVSYDEAIAYFLRYQDYDIVNNSVLSTGNVLYSPPYTKIEDCRASIQEALALRMTAPPCEAENHAYTLIPRDENWDLIKWFFRDHFGS